MSAAQKNSFHLLSLLSNFLSKNNKGPLQFWETGYSKCNNEFIQSKHKILYQVYTIGEKDPLSQSQF